MVMRMEADRMANLRIVEKELTPERQVVLEERRMRTDNVPSSLLDEAARERLFGTHKPYGMPVSGYVDDVKKLTPADLTAFYKKHYAPNNAVLIVAGDTSTDSVRKLAEHYYGPLAKKPIESRRRPSSGGTDLPQRVIRADARVVEARWGRDYLAPSYRMGETRHAYALTVWPACWAAARPAACGARWSPSRKCPVGVGGLRPIQPRPHHLRPRRPTGARP